MQFEFNTRLFGAVEAANKNSLKGNYSAANYRASKSENAHQQTGQVDSFCG